MLQSVSFLLLLLFSLSFSHDFKTLVLAEDELQNGSTLECGGEPSCYRKGNPYKSNGSTVGSEIQTSRQLLMADLDRTASRGVLSPSISYHQSRLLPLPTILSPAQNMLNNSKLASSANISASVVESPPVFSGKLRNKGSNWPLLWTINTPQFCSLSPPSLTVQPSVHPSTHKQIFTRLVLDHMPHLGTPKFSVRPVFLQGVTSRSLIPRAHVHNVLPFVSPYRSLHQEANHNGAPYFLIPPSSLTTGKMKPIEAASLPYYSVRSGPSLSLTQYRQSQEMLRFGKYTHSVPPFHALPVTAPSLVPMHYGQPQDPSSQRIQAPENQPSVRFLPPSNGRPLQTLPPIASDREKAQGPFANENRPPKALPPTLATLGPPTVTSPPFLSPHDHQYQMHPSAFHSVMLNPSNYIKWVSPRVSGTPSEMQPPVEHSRTSASPTGTVSSPTSLPSELSEPPEAAPSIIFPSHAHHHNMQGPIASSPSIFPSEPPQKKPGIPFAARPRNIPRGQAPLALTPRIQEHVIPPINLPSRSPLEYSGRPASTPSIAFHSPQYHGDENVQGPIASSPNIFPFVPRLKKPSIPVTAHPRSRSKSQTPVGLAPKNQEPVTTSINLPSKAPVEYLGTPEAVPSIRFHYPPHNWNVKGHLKPPGNAPSEPPKKQLRIPVASPPRIRSRWHAPVVIPPTSQGPFPSPPLAFPPEEHYGKNSGVPPFPLSITFSPPPYHRSMEGPVAAPTSITSSASKSPKKMPNVPWEAPPSKRSWSHSPTAIPPINQAPVSSPNTIPFEPSKGNLIHPAPAPSRISPIPHHYWGMEGPVASIPSIIPSAPAEKKPNVPVAAPPSKRPSKHAPVASPPMVEGPVASTPGMIPSAPAEKKPYIPVAAPPSKRSSTPAPVASPPIVQGPVASTPSMIQSAPAEKKPNVPVAAPPSKRSSSHAPVASPPMVEGPVASTPSMIPSAPAEKNPYVPVAAPPSKRSSKHAPVASLPMVQGPVSSTPSMIQSAPAEKKPNVPVAAPPSKRSSNHAPVASPPMVEGPVYSPANHSLLSPSGNLRPPAVSPSVGFPSPLHHRHVEGPVSSPITIPFEPPKGNLRHPVPPLSRISPIPHHSWGMEGPVTSTPSMIPSAPAREKPNIPVAAPPSKRSSKHPPVASLPMVEGPVVSTPSMIPSAPAEKNPYVPEAAPPSKRPSKHAPVASLPMVQGPVASTPSMISSAPPEKKPNVPVAAPPRKRSSKHATVASPPMVEGSVYSPVNHPRLSPSGNLRPPAISPSVRFPSPPHHRHVKGPVSSPITIPFEPPKGNLRRPAPPLSRISPIPHHSWGMEGPVTSTPSMIPSAPARERPNIPVAAPPSKRSSKHPPVASPPMVEGPVTSTPSMIPSAPAENKPNVPVAAPPSKRSSNHVPVASPPMVEGNFKPPAVSPSFTFPSTPHHRHVKGPVSSPITLPFESPKGNLRRPAPAPWGMEGPVASTPSMIPSSPAQKKPNVPVAAPPSKRSPKDAPVASPPMVEGPVNSPVNHPPLSRSVNLRPPAVSPSVRFRSHPHHRHVKGPVSSPMTIPFESPKGNFRHPAPAPSRISPVAHHYRGMEGPVASTPSMIPSAPPEKKPNVPVAAPPRKRPSKHAPVASPPMVEGSVYSPVNHPLLSPSGNLRPPVISPSVRFPSPPHHRHVKGPSASTAPAPSGISPTNHYWGMKGPVASTPRMIPSAPAQNNPSIPMAAPPSKRSSKHAPVASPPIVEGPVYSPVNHPLLSPAGNLKSPAFSPSISSFSPHHRHVKGPSASSASIAPSEPPQMTRGIPLAAPPLVFPPPPPSQDCNSTPCIQPLTSTPPGAPCGCVFPMQVELELGVALYAFFPLVSELAAEIAAGTFLKQSQVRIMGANADSQDQEKTIVILDLVPLGEKFDNTTAFLIFERFWQKKVIINGTLFGNYWVIFVSYPGLPPPPPSAFSSANIDGEPTSNSGPSKHEPIGVDINKRSKKMGTGIIAVVALSSAIGVVICVGAVWIILLKCKNSSRPNSAVVESTLVSSVTKRSGCGGSILSGSMVSSTSMSFASSMAPYTGSAKTITLAELERATDRFNPQSILGEGGFGRVYRGVLEDGTKVAVKVLTRDDQQGGREFIAEVEMLSRLHHRNLVKLIGICTEEHNRSLVYELIPNGSVESHLHGLDKETAPLDWDARIKIALGAARGLAYLHEDSSPRVIHRDFKASNILLEEDFTPKVSDFGLAKSASEEVSGHISTRVMGTFGYVAPEYAMTGHLLVKSDVYSYGVVLLELLSGRKPVDMSQPPGQENLVTWARPLLTSKEGLEALVDPALGSNLPFDNIARVAAIASMCVQPEVSHRPFMGEVVQALKLVYNDSDASNGGGSGSFSQGGESYAHDTEVRDGSSQQWPQSIQYVPDGSSFVTIDYDSGPLQTQGLGAERPLSASALLSNSGSLMRQLSGSFRRHSSSGPLRTNKSKKSSYGVGGLAGGSISEHGVKRHGDVHELWP